MLDHQSAFIICGMIGIIVTVVIVNALISNDIQITLLTQNTKLYSATLNLTSSKIQSEKNFQQILLAQNISKDNNLQLHKILSMLENKTH